MNVEIGTETPIFLFWEYFFRNFGILSLQWKEKRREFEWRWWLSMVREGNDRMKYDKRKGEIKSWIEQTVTLRVILKQTEKISELKGAQVWDFRPIFFNINKSYMGRWLEDWRKKNYFSKTTVDIRHFVFFTQAEPALKICLRRLSLR
jgi:hypothetical protein